MDAQYRSYNTLSNAEKRHHPDASQEERRRDDSRMLQGARMLRHEGHAELPHPAPLVEEEDVRFGDRHRDSEEKGGKTEPRDAVSHPEIPGEEGACGVFKGGQHKNLQTDPGGEGGADRKSTRLNSSHGYISYAVFCLKKK